MGSDNKNRQKLIKIETGGISGDHYYLEPDDECVYVGDYTPRGGYSCSPINQTIINLKKKEGDGGYHYKDFAIRQVAREFLSGLNLSVIERSFTFVPVPPSKVRGHQYFDDRMIQVLGHMNAGGTLDCRELVIQRESTSAAHQSASRPSPDELAKNYYINENCSLPEPKNFIVVDDVLTMGAHFKAMQMVLRNRYPDIGKVIGLFYARSVREDIVDDFDIIIDQL